MIRAFGREYLIPGSPAARSKEPMEQACPTHQVAIGVKNFMFGQNQIICAPENESDLTPWLF
uniref:Uncharacterized protein n=1 Tax=Megaselia scalaris TaxID=36166 RepID=T1GWQ9_MEGSC